MPLNREYWWSTKQPQVTDLPCWQLGFQWHRWGIELVFKSLDCFTKRLFHTATFFAATYVFVVWNFTRLITSLKSFFFFFNLDLVGEHSAPMYLPVYYLRCVLISRPPRVFRRFKRRSCMFMIWDSRQQDWQLFWLSFEHCKLALKPNKDNHHEQSYYCF